ncbi:MAG: hypothetical protein GX612_00110 [Bacteroidales bacterium]|nr:hypothetical protein [Bacteroidales bacterium]
MLLMLICPITALASTITVGPIGCNYTHIWEALDAANPGDVIEVQNGTYYEKLIIDRPIILRGNNTIIDARGLRSPIELISDGITLEGLTIVNSGDEDNDAGIRVKSCNNSIINNNICLNNYGIYLETSAGNVISGNSIHSNYNDGIYLLVSDNNTIESNAINYNTISYHSATSMFDRVYSYPAGILLKESSNNTITSNIIANNDGCGISIELSNKNRIISNFIFKNYIGIYIYKGNIVPANNTLANNYLINNEKYNACDEYDEGRNPKNKWYTKLDNITIGNRYGDFDEPKEGCRDVDKDGICDFAYEIPGDKTIDNYPISSQLVGGTITKYWNGSLKNKNYTLINMTVPSNVTLLSVSLTWDDSDSDFALFLFNQTGQLADVSSMDVDDVYWEPLNQDDAELCVETINPESGIWKVVIYGYRVPEGREVTFKLEVLQF